MLCTLQLALVFQDINDGNASKTGSQSQHSGQIGTDSVEVDHEDGAIETNVHYSNALCEDTEVISQVVSEDIRTGGDVLAQGYGEGRERLQHILDKLSTADCEDDTSRKSDYSDILGETVNFQGQDVTVSSLLGEAILPETESLLEAFSKSLSTGNKPVIGCACASDAGYYVPRTLQRKTYVRGDIFKHRTSKLPTVFAVSGMTKQQLQEIVPPGENICRFDESSGVENAGPRFILLNDLTAQHDYNDLCKRARNLKTIHWLKKQPGGLEWKKSEGSIDVIHKYIDLDKSKYFASLTDMEGETVILTGNDGEGKSTYLTNLKREINRTSPATWVIRLNLHEHVSDIDKCDLTEARVIELLSSAAGLGTSLERALLRYSLQTTKNLAVLVDEMGFRHRDDGLELLRVLKDMKMQNLVIAAHPCTTTLIENALSVLAFTLKPLARDELQVLMTKFWETNSKYTNDTLCDEFSTALLNLIEKSFVKGKSPTPLDIKMAAHAFEKGYAAFLMSKVIDLPQHLDVTELYEKYIKREFEMHENTGAGSDEDWTSYLKNITHTSMLSVFPEETVKQFVSHEERVSKASAQFTFLHRCLKDYVTAKWFAENYQSHRSYIRDKYFAAELQSMWVMYDRILAKQYELHTSVLDRDPQKVRGLLSNGSDMNSLDNGGRTALHLAAIQTKYFAEGDPKCVETASLLIDRGADISTVDTVLQWTALRYADTIGSWTMIDRLLQGRADISDMACTEKKLLNRTSLQELASDAAANGLTHLTAYILGTGLDINTPLHSTKYSQQQYGLVHIASENGHVSLLEFLLKSNADVNMCNSDKSTPLHLACRQGNKDCVVMLLHSQARVNQSNKNGDTPLHEAVRSGHCDTVQILLNRNADVYLCNKYGDTPLHVACQGKNLTAVCQLMDTKADKNIRNRNGDSPLDCAILGGHTTLVRYMLRRAGASLLEGEGDGRTPLHLAAVTGDVLMLDCLLQVKPRVDVSTAGGDTALHLACLHGNTDAAVLLLKRGAEINRANKHGNTPLHLASVRGNMDTLNALLERNAQVNVCNMEDNTPLHLASLQGKANAVQCLIKHDADAGTKNREKHTPLQLATIKGDLEVMRLLTEANSDVNVANRYGTTILHQCARNGRVDIVKLLLNSGRCNLDAKDSKGDTPLLAATKSGFADIVECLALCGADIHFRSRDGNAPIHIAVTSENLELVNRLGKLGADLNVRNSQGNTPLHRAVCCGDEVMIRHLVERGVDRTVANRAGDTPFDLAIQMGTNDSILKIL
jgi:ankyrin repeat protein